MLVFVRRHDAVLLLRGAPNKPIWPGLLNGIGGHVEAGEDPLSAARRELREECGLDVPAAAVRLAALIVIDLGADRTGVLLLVFAADCDQEPPACSVEGTLEWHRLSQLDGLPLVPDLAWLLPRIWGPNIVFAHYRYDAAGRLVIDSGDVARSRGT